VDPGQKELNELVILTIERTLIFKKKNGIKMRKKSWLKADTVRVLPTG